MHLLWHWFCCFFKLGLCSLRCYYTGGSGMISIHYGQQLRFQVSSPRRSLKPFPFLCLKVTRQWKHAAGEPGCSLFLCVYAYNYIYFYVCVCVCVHAFICRFLQNIKQKSKSRFLLEGMGEHQTNPTEWLLNQMGLNGATNYTPVPPLAFWPTSVPIYTHRSRSPQPAAPGEPSSVRWHPNSV